MSFTIVWTERLNPNPDQEKDKSGLSFLKYRLQVSRLSDKAKRLAGKLPLNLRVGLFIDCGPLDEWRATSNVPELMKEKLTELGVEVLYLHPEASASAAGEGSWRNGIMLGQEMDLAAIGSCFSWSNGQHRLTLDPYLPNGFQVRDDFKKYDWFTITAESGWKQSYEVLALKGVIKILETLIWKMNLKEIPAHGWLYDINSWWEGFTLPTLEANAERLSFSVSDRQYYYDEYDRESASE